MDNARGTTLTNFNWAKYYISKRNNDVTLFYDKNTIVVEQRGRTTQYVHNGKDAFSNRLLRNDEYNECKIYIYI